MSVRTDVVNLQVNIKGNQAQKDLGDLKKKAADIRFEMQGLKKGTQEYIDKAKELSQVNGSIDDLKKRIGLTSLTLKELRQEQTKLNALMSSSIPFSEEYKKYQEQLGAVNKRIGEVKSGAQGFSAMFNEIGASLKNFGPLALAYLGFEALVKNLPAIISANAKLSDQLADIRKATNLSSAAVGDLNKELQKIDTRTSTDDLRSLAVEAGKLGIEGKENILGFVRAADQIRVALGEDLGEDAVTSLGKLVSIFKVDKDFGLEDALLKVGSAINDIGASSSAEESYIVDFTKRLGGIGPSAKISIQDLIALAGTMDSLGQTAEVSTTAIGGVLSKMVTDFDGFARIAGISTQKLQDTFKDKGGLEALKLVLDGVNKTGGGFEELITKLGDVGIEGSKAKGVLSVLANNLTELSRQQGIANSSFEQGTSLTNEFTLKNQTLGAELDKLSNKIKNVFTSGALADFFGYLAKGVNDFLTPTRSATDELTKLSKEVRNLDKNIDPLAKRYDDLKAKTTLNKNEQTELKNIIAKISGVIPSAITQFDNYGNAIGISTQRVYDYIRAEKARLKAVNADSIKGYEDRVGDVSKQIERQKAILDQIAKGAFTISSSASGGTGGASTYTRAATDAEKQDQVKKYKDLLELQEGYQTEIKRLRGDALQDQLDANKKTEEEDKKDGENKKKKYQVDIADLKQRIDNYNKDLASFKGSKKEYDIKLAARNQLQKQLDDLDGKTARQHELQTDNDYASLKKQAEKFYADVQKIKDKAAIKGEGPEQQEIDQVILKYQQLLDKAKEFFSKHAVEKKKFDEEEILLEKAKQDELFAIITKFSAEKEYEQSLAYTRSYYDQKKVLAVNDYADGLISEQEYNKQIKTLDQHMHDDLVVVANDYSSSVKKAAEDVKTFRKTQEEETTKNTIDETKKRKEVADQEKQAAIQRKVLSTQPGTKANLAAQKDLLQQQFDQETQGLDKRSELYLLKQQELNQKLAALDKDAALKKINDWIAIAQQTSQLVDTFFQIAANKENAQLARDKQINDQKKANLDRQLKSKVISQTQYNRAVAKLDEDYDKKKKAMEVRQFRRNQAMQISQALISGAQGVLSVLAAVPGPLDIASLGTVRAIMIGLTTAITGAQVAAIATQKPPEGRRGLIVSGPSHEGGGVDLVERRSGRTLANVEGGEPLWVFSKDTYKNNKPFLDQLIYNSMYRQGASIMPSFQKAYTPINAARMVPIMKDGGVVNSAKAGLTQDDETKVVQLRILNAIENMNGDINGWNRELTAKVLLKDINSQTSLLDAAKKASGLKQ